MPDWRPAPSVAALLAQLDAAFPGRDRRSDGVIGDAAHQAEVSDHNPDSRGIVHAVDADADPVAGNQPFVAGRLNGQWLVDQIVGRRDPRVKYVIFNRRMWRSYDKPAIPAWSPAPYSGPSPHTEHVHVSVLSTPEAENDTSPWFHLDPGDEMTKAELLDLLRSPDGQDAIANAVLNKMVTDAGDGKRKRLRDVLYLIGWRTKAARDGIAETADSVAGLAKMIQATTGDAAVQQLAEQIAGRVDRLRVVISSDPATGDSATGGAQ